MTIALLRRSAPTLLIAFLCALAPFTARAHGNPGYSHDSGPGGNYSNPSWMARISDGRRLSEMSIPGTHDTMAVHGGDVVETQSMNLRKQLDSGIRVLDIRCRHVKNAFKIYHGFVDQKATFDDVMSPVVAFLAANPRETVLMRVKKEYNDDGNSRAFDETFAAYVKKYPGKFWTPTATNKTNPTLGEVRGKIVVLQNFDSSTDYGIRWSTLSIQDDYNFGNNWDLEKKWNSVWAHVNAAARDKSKIHVNFLSGSGGSMPYFVASGHSSNGTSAPRLATGKTTPLFKDCCKMFPRVDCAINICTIAFEGTNVLLYERLKTMSLHLGIIMADFPGHGLIESVIHQNPGSL